MHSGGFDLTKLTYNARLEDNNLMRHRGRPIISIYMGMQGGSMVIRLRTAPLPMHYFYWLSDIKRAWWCKSVYYILHTPSSR